MTDPTGPIEPAQNGNSHGADEPGQTPARSSWLILAVLVIGLIVIERQHLAFLLGVLIFIVALLVSVMLHELGHFLTAKKFRMRVTQFFVGFGRTLWSTHRGETEYGIKALLVGGYVKIVGMTSIDDVDVADEPRSFRAKPGWQRMIVLAAGSFMHFVFALFLFFVLAFAIGQPNSNTNAIGSITPCVPRSSWVLNHANDPCAGRNLGKSPAVLAGIKPGDKIISVAGTPVRTWGQPGTRSPASLHKALTGQATDASVPVVIRRAGHDMTLQLKLAKIPGRPVPYIGVEPAVVSERSSFLGAWSYAGNQFADTITSSASAVSKLPSAIPDLFAKNRTPQSAAGQVSSVYGVADFTGQVVQAAVPWQYKLFVVLLIIASLNIFVGVFNLLPLLPLDGGHLAIVIFERLRAWFNRLRGRPDPGLVDIQRLVPVSLLVFAVLVGFATLLIAADIFNPVHLQV
ncbi:MAG: site-2 protease family protein [Actinobacteria bacterium]|nr:site-2 protease family protein [Actinomycetota bacterium]